MALRLFSLRCRPLPDWEIVAPCEPPDRSHNPCARCGEHESVRGSLRNRAGRTLLWRDVITGAIEHLADRVRHLVYIDAFLPNDGESLFTLTGRSDQLPLEVGAAYLDAGLGFAWTSDDPADGAFTDARQSLQSVATFIEPVHLERPLEEYPFTRTYIKATAEARTNGTSAFMTAGDYAKASPRGVIRKLLRITSSPRIGRPSSWISSSTSIDALRDRGERTGLGPRKGSSRVGRDA